MALKQVNLLTSVALLFLITPLLVFAAEPTGPKILLGQIENSKGEVWLIEGHGVPRAGRPGKKIFTGDCVKASAAASIRFLNGNLLEVFPGTVAEFTPQGRTRLIGGQGVISLIGGERRLLHSSEETGLSRWPEVFEPALDGSCEKLLLEDWLGMLVLNRGLEGYFPDKAPGAPTPQLCRQINTLLEKQGFAPFPCDNLWNCLERDFYVEYFYDALAAYYNWPVEIGKEEKRAILVKEGYLHSEWCELECICRREAQNMLWDLFMKASPGQSALPADPYETPFPNLYEIPVSPIK